MDLPCLPVPTGYLLDPNGRIILKEVGFTEGGRNG